jgi:hypothetical protein
MLSLMSNVGIQTGMFSSFLKIVPILQISARPQQSLLHNTNTCTANGCTEQAGTSSAPSTTTGTGGDSSTVLAPPHLQEVSHRVGHSIIVQILNIFSSTW